MLEIKQSNCIVLPLLQKFSSDELCNPSSGIHIYFLKTITRCKCIDHKNEEPYKLPSLEELTGDLTSIITDLMDWTLDEMADPSASIERKMQCDKLLEFIHCNCISDSDNSLFNILDTLNR
jgi:hypothetical protein